jgi:uncharacterized membrane protein YgcG
MAALPVDVLLGIYLGILVGIIPALVAWALGFSFKYATGVSLPGFAVVVVAIALAGVNGGLLAVTDPSITTSPNAATIVTALLLVAMGSIYAHAKGDAMGASVPRRLSLSELRQRTLSAELADLVGGGDEVRIHVAGSVADMEGYPPLPEDVRREIRTGEWTFPADLRIAELEDRLADRLRTAFDLGDVAVTIDERGAATVVAAPPFSGLSKRIDSSRRAVSVDALIPTGLARGDEVTVLTTDTQARGTVVSATTTDGEAPAPAIEPRSDDAVATAEPGAAASTEPEAAAGAARAPTTTGGEGRLTVAVTRTDAESLVGAERAKVVVESRGTRREYELISMLRRADHQFRRLTVGPDTPLDGTTLDEAALRTEHDVAVFAVRDDEGWSLAPGAEGDSGRGGAGGDTGEGGDVRRGGDDEGGGDGGGSGESRDGGAGVTLEAGEDLYVVGTREALEAFAEVVA